MDKAEDSMRKHKNKYKDSHYSSRATLFKGEMLELEAGTESWNRT